MTSSPSLEPQEISAPSPPSTELPARFFAMDALRASAMLLGVVFHAAWIFAPSYLWTPITERNGNWYCFYFFFTCHMFRMQLFFLMAGFFAALLIEKRGVRGFLKNRVIRILIPLVVGWSILFPIMSTFTIIGGRRSGRIQSTADFGDLFLESFESQNLFVFSFDAFVVSLLFDAHLHRSGRGASRPKN